jgi:hypothetical protein
MGWRKTNAPERNSQIFENSGLFKYIDMQNYDSTRLANETPENARRSQMSLGEHRL